MSTALNGKTAVITGAGREDGLGYAIATALAEAGASIVLSDIGRPDTHAPEDKIGTHDEAERLAGRLADATGVSVRAVDCDVRRETDVERVFDAAAELGGVDILVNNAGIGYLMKPIFDATLDEWQAVLDVNLTGAWLCTRAAAKRMRERGRGGRIVNIASQAAKSGFPNLAAYVASKHGMVGLTRATAVELGQHGITVNAVCPNHVTTGLGAEQNEYFSRFLGMSVDEYLDAMRSRIPVGRIGRATDTANAVVFLCSPAADFITGEALNVSGGEEMH